METEVMTTSPIVVSPSTPQTPTLAPAKHRASRKSATSTTPAFLSNLGRANLRGIRKCPQCGVYNGTRGLSCKNKACGITLRNPTSSSSTTNSAGGRSGKKCVVEVVRVIIDSEERGSGKERVGGTGGVQVFSVCHKGRGATATQLGFVELVPTDTAIATGDGATLLTRINLGRCFLPSCRQGQRSSQAHNESESLSATASGSKQSSDSLCIHIKQAIECRTPATPLTLKSSVLEGLQASSQAREELWRLALESPGPLVQRIAKDTLVVKCHTDSQHPLGLLHLTVGAAGLSEGGKSQRRSGKEQQQHAGVFHCACQAGGKRGKAGIEGAGGSTSSPQPCLHFYACVCAFTSDEKLASEFTAFINYTPSALQQNVTSRVISPGSTQAVDERTVTFGFHQWLAGVTERIHQTMHYQFDGKPQPLVYHVPQEFFNALQHRLSLGSKKKRLPNFTTAFVRSDGLPPLGPFFKYTWHITNLMHVKHIFDTPELPLELYQSFVKNVDGSYSSFHCPEPPPEPEAPEGQRADRPHAIRPMELRTFLRVGPGSADEKEAGPFVMEWTPDVLPRCQMGELRISFEFGHQQSGQAENTEKTVSAEKGTRNSSQPKLKTALEVLQLVV